MRPPQLDDDYAVGAAVFLGGRPSCRLRVRRRAPVPPPAVTTFDPVIGKRQAGSISTLGAAETAVSARIVVVLLLVVSPIVVVSRKMRRCGGSRVGELGIGGAKPRKPKLLRLTNSLFATALPLLLHNNDGAHDGNPADDDSRPNRRQRQPQSRDRALPPFVNDGLKRRFQRHYRGRVAPETKTTTSIASHDNGSPNGVVVVELWRSQPTPAPTSRNSTWGVVWTVTTAEPTMGMSGMTSPSFLLSQETVVRSFGALLPQVSSCSLHFFSL